MKWSKVIGLNNVYEVLGGIIEFWKKTNFVGINVYINEYTDFVFRNTFYTLEVNTSRTTTNSKYAKLGKYIQLNKGINCSGNKSTGYNTQNFVKTVGYTIPCIGYVHAVGKESVVIQTDYTPKYARYNVTPNMLLQEVTPGMYSNNDKLLIKLLYASWLKSLKKVLQ